MAVGHAIFFRPASGQQVKASAVKNMLCDLVI